MANVLAVPAFEVGAPVTVLVAVKACDLTFHLNLWRRRERNRRSLFYLKCDAASKRLTMRLRKRCRGDVAWLPTASTSTTDPSFSILIRTLNITSSAGAMLTCAESDQSAPCLRSISSVRAIGRASTVWPQPVVVVARNREL